jgi:gluconolactonase
MFKWLLFLFFISLTHASSHAQLRLPALATGYIDYKDSSLQTLISNNAAIEVIGSGFEHIESPVWVADSSMLLFSDTKAGVIYRWKQDSGISVFLKNTGFTGRLPYSEEPGSNGLAVDGKGNLIICNHGDRRISSYPLNGNYGQQTVADNFEGKRLNSPNDVLVKSDGSIWFTDPPYGLPKKDKDPTRELDVAGVYRKTSLKETELMIGDLPLPNGLCFSTDEKLFYVSISDSLNPRIMVYSLDKNGKPQNGKIFFDASDLLKNRQDETTDGLKCDKNGNVWATGPGGILIINAAGKLLGIIRTGEIMSNCTWGNNCYLYITAGAFLYRVQTLVK